MGAAKGSARRSMDRRTRHVCAGQSVDLQAFLEGEWSAALMQNGQRAAADAKRLALTPLTIDVDGRYWTLSVADDTLGSHAAPLAAARVRIDQAAFDDLISNRKTAMGLLVHRRVEGSSNARALFNRWDPVLRSVLDAWHVYRPGEITLADRRGGALDLQQYFRLDDDSDTMAHFFSEAGLGEGFGMPC